MNYLLRIVDDTLDKHADTVFVCFSDLNQLNLNRLQAMTGLSVLVDFPTIGDTYLDHCLINRPDLFNKSVKTDHTGFVIPAGTKLKPIRREVKMWDCRDHRKGALHNGHAEVNWDDVLLCSDVDEAVCLLEEKISDHVDRCMPVSTVSISSRDLA